MDHVFEFDSRPSRHARTITVRAQTFCWDPWPEDLLAALADLNIDEMAGGARGTLATPQVTICTNVAAGEFEVVIG